MGELGEDDEIKVTEKQPPARKRSEAKCPLDLCLLTTIHGVRSG